jgi:hypothetical protein
MGASAPIIIPFNKLMPPKIQGGDLLIASVRFTGLGADEVTGHPRLKAVHSVKIRCRDYMYPNIRQIKE